MHQLLMMPKLYFDMSSRCIDERDFVSKVQALATFATRFNEEVKNLIVNPTN